MSLIDVIVVTWNLPDYAVPCVRSILRNIHDHSVHIYVINNGEAQHEQYFPKSDFVTVLNQKDNLGWEGGLKVGLKASKAPYVVFMNDDTYIPQSSHDWLEKLNRHFTDPRCAAVGPASNVVMGSQNAFAETSELAMVNFLIGFCLMVRRSDLDAAGGVDDTLPGGDDLDLSIRLKNLGKFLICDKSVFVYHHGFKSGERAHGSDYNSANAIERTNWGLINKHGLRAFQNLWGGPPWNPDEEGKLIASMITSDQKTVELGCGARKTVPWAVGYDILPKGSPVPNVFPAGNSVADYVTDVTEPLPIDPESQDVAVARHILEHVENPEKTIQNWSRILKHGGRLIVAVPDGSTEYSEALDHDHKQAFTPEKLKALMESQGLHTVDLLDPKNGVSFIGVFSRNGQSQVEGGEVF